jgi:CRP/FNR family transcriptional regulator
VSAPSSAEVVELLARVPIFSTLEPEDLQRIAQLAVPRGFDAGQVIFREGDASDTCYVVRTGRTRAVHQHGDGRIITLATFGPGDIFGELALFEDELRSATLEALQETSVLAILGPDMRRLMSEHPQIAMRLVIALGRRLREANERLARRSFQSVQSRVAAVLSELVAQAQGARRAPADESAAGDAQAETQASGDASGVGRGAVDRDVPIVATQTDLAKLAGSSRESASRFLAVLERAGVISQGRGKLVVHDPDALRSYVF